MSYLQLENKYICFFEEFQEFRLAPNADYDCNPEKYNVSQCHVDEDNPETLQNWIQRLDLHCESKTKVGFIGSCYFIGFLIGALFFPRLSDTFGRKRFVIFGICVHAIIQIGFVVFDNLYVYYALIIMMGTVAINRASIGFILGMESIPESSRFYSGAAFHLVDGSMNYLGSFYFLLISRDWIYFGYFNVGLGFIILILAVIFLLESPKFFYTKGRFAEARQVINKIAKTNKAP